MFLTNCLLDILGNVVFMTAYVTNSSSFPQPLSDEEEEYYLKKLEQGDLLAKSILVERI